jgi:hypothetical protein
MYMALAAYSQGRSSIVLHSVGTNLSVDICDYVGICPVLFFSDNGVCFSTTITQPPSWFGGGWWVGTNLSVDICDYGGICPVLFFSDNGVCFSTTITQPPSWFGGGWWVGTNLSVDICDYVGICPIILFSVFCFSAIMVSVFLRLYRQKQTVK